MCNLSLLFNQAWINRLQSYSQLLVGYSGGLDSTVLLHALASIPALKHKLQAVHIHHGLSPTASCWQAHCEAFCHASFIPLSSHRVLISSASNLEEKARDARFDVFKTLLKSDGCLLLAHHQDDQAETMLLHLARGTGIDGFSGMLQMLPLSKGTIIKPLLDYSKQDLMDYAKQHGLSWVDDESNDNIAFSRNYMRHAVLPSLQKKWPHIAKNMSQCALHLQEAQKNLNDLAVLDYPELTQRLRHLPLPSLMHLSSARLNNVLRSWLSHLHIQAPSSKTFERLLSEVVYARVDGMPCVRWGDIEIRRYRQTLYVLKKSEFHFLENIPWADFPSVLKLTPHESLVAVRATSGIYIPPDSHIEIRFRMGGEQIKLRGQTHCLKKLFQTWGIPPWVRAHIPLIYIDNELAAVLDFCTRDPYDDVPAQHIYTIKRKVNNDLI